MRALHHALALIVALFWAASYFSTQILYDHGVGPFAVLILKAVLAYGLLIFLAPKRLYAGSIKAELKCMLLGAAFLPLYGGLTNLALANGQAANTAVILSTGPLIGVVVASALLARVKIHWTTHLGLWSAVTGVALVMIDGEILHGFSADADLLAVGAALAWAVYALILQRLRTVPPALAARKCLGWGIVAAMPFYFMEEPTEAMVLTEPVVIGNLLFLSWGAMAAGLVLWHRAVQVIGAEAANYWHYLTPFAAIAIGAAFFEEQMTFIGFMGAALTLCGLVLGQRGVNAAHRDAARRRQTAPDAAPATMTAKPAATSS